MSSLHPLEVTQYYVALELAVCSKAIAAASSLFPCEDGLSAGIKTVLVAMIPRGRCGEGRGRCDGHTHSHEHPGKRPQFARFLLALSTETSTFMPGVVTGHTPHKR